MRDGGPRPGPGPPLCEGPGGPGGKGIILGPWPKEKWGQPRQQPMGGGGGGKKGEKREGRGGRGPAPKKGKGEKRGVLKIFFFKKIFFNFVYPL